MTETLRVLYEDEHLLAVDKPPWVLSVPGRKPEHQDSIATRARDQYGDIHIVHRLDCATSGVMILAKSKAVEKQLHQQFRERQTDKEYIAVGAGTACLSRGQVQLPLITDWPNRPRQKVDFTQGKHSVTRFELLEQHPDSARMRLYPVTGRSHQLRLHMKYLGLPIVGDRLYAPDAVANASERMLLHAHALRLQHPVNGHRLNITAPCPF